MFQGKEVNFFKIERGYQKGYYFIINEKERQSRRESLLWMKWYM